MPLKLTRREGSAVWHVSGTIQGMRIRESTGIADRGLAEEYRAKREAELYRGAVYGHKAAVEFGAAVSSYVQDNRPGRETKQLLAKLLVHFGRATVREIDQEAVDRAVSVLCPDVSPARKVRAVVTPLSAVLNHAAHRGWCDRPAFRRPAGAGGNKRTRWLRPDEYARLHDAASPHLRPLLAFLICTGARVSEALRLTWADVDLSHAHCTLRGVKARHGEVRDRPCELPPAAVAALAGLPHRVGAVFLNDHAKPYRERGTTGGGQIKTAFHGACQRAGFAGRLVGEGRGRYWQPEDVSPHTLRHSWATWHYAVHRDLLLLKVDGGWSSVAMVERYAKLAPRGMAPAVQAVWGTLLPQNHTGDDESGRFQQVG